MADFVYGLGHIAVFLVQGNARDYHVAIDPATLTVECDCASGYYRKSPWRMNDMKMCRHCEEAILEMAKLTGRESMQ